MKKIHCTFYRPEKVNIREFQNIVGKLESDLDTICNSQISLQDASCYAFDLLRQARPLEHVPQTYYLGLDDPNQMPADARVDFFYRPTYLGAAIIIRLLLRHPQLADEKTELGWEDEDELRRLLKDVFPGLLLGCTGRGFQGHGYDALEGLLDTLHCFAKAGAPEFIEKYPEICPEFGKLFAESIAEIRAGAEAGTLQNEWGVDYGKEAAELLQLADQSR